MPLPQLALLALLALLLVAAATTDIRSRIIPNGLNIVVAVLAIAWWLARGLTPQEMGFQLIVAFLAFAFFATTFALGFMGGGDVKLIAALALWLPAPLLFKMLVLMAIAGGVLTVAMVAASLARRAERRPEIPYGVAIAGAALFVMANDLLTISPA